MKGSKLYNTIDRGERVFYVGILGNNRFISVEDAIDTLASGSFASEEILKSRENREKLLAAIGRLEAQLAEAKGIIADADADDDLEREGWGK